MIDDFDFPSGDLSQTLLFLKEAGKLKSVIRQTHLQNEDRLENVAEHSWHLILMAICLQKHANENIDITRVIKMLAIHDLGEIYFGDVFLYDSKRDAGKSDERGAFIELINKAPSYIHEEFLDLWDEFESGKTPEAQYVQGLDRFQPFMEQLDNGGSSWKRHNITHKKALAKNQHINDGSTELWELYQDLSQQAQDKKLFHEDEQE